MKITKYLRFLLIALAAVMAFSLFACTDPENEEESSSVEEPSESESTPVGGPEDSDDSSEETSTPETDCQHVEEVIDAVAATCEATGLTAGKKCSVCGEILEAQTEVPALGHAWDAGSVTTKPTCAAAGVKTFTCANDATHTKTEEVPALGHTVKFTAYVANPDGDEAMISGECSVCKETVVKPASMLFSIESIFGNNGETDVMVFNGATAGETIMGTGLVEFAQGHKYYPANGYAPIPGASATGFGNLMGVGGWAGYLGSSVADSAAYKIVDADGTVLVDWTAVKDLVPPLGGVTYKADGEAAAAIDAVLGNSYTDASTTHIKFNHIINIMDHYSVIQGKNVKVVFAFVTAQGVDGDVYIPYVSLDTAIPACEHVASEPDKDDNCNVKCTKCGAVIEAAKHTMSDFALDAEGPQNEVASCSVCGHKEYRPATTTLEGLTLLTPEYLASMTVHGNLTSVTVETDENGMKYYHAVGKAGGLEATLVFNNGSEAMKGVGNYIVMLMRKSAGTPSIESWVNYVGRTDHTDGNGTKSTANLAPSIKCDNSWQLVFFDYTGKEQMSVENGIGWSRFDIMNGTIVEGETIDIAFVGFFTSVDKVIEYYGAYVNNYFGKENCFYHVADGSWSAADTEGYRKATCSVCGNEVVEKIPFTLALDTTNCSLNGERSKFVTGARHIDETWVIDASAYTLTQADGIGLGGWCVTPEGIAKYQFRVVSVDGTAVENPVLVDYFEGGSSAGITKVGTDRGWTADCGNGAAWQSPSPRLLDLTGYEGKTVNVEVVATTTYGASFVIFQINNIAVPAAQ